MSCSCHINPPCNYCMEYRKLLWHAESDCYWEVCSEVEYLNDLSDGYTEDVTDYEHHEEKFKARDDHD